MLLPQHVYSLFEVIDDIDAFQKVCSELEEENLFFSIDDWEEDIRSYGYDTLLNQIWNLNLFLQDKEFSIELKGKLVWLARVLQKYYKIVILKELFTIALDQGDFINFSLDSIQNKEQILIETSFSYCDEIELSSVQYDFSLALHQFFFVFFSR